MVSTKKTGVLLVNLGSPDSPKTGDVRRYLREFLGDPRVVNIPKPIWWVILNFLVLPFRPKKSAHAYQQIWTKQGSPLEVLTERLGRQLAKKLRLLPSKPSLEVAMRYGKPSISQKLKALQQQGVTEFIVLPLYPQYSMTTTASIYDAMITEFNQWSYLPSFRFINDYHQHPAYIQALATSIKNYWQENGREKQLLMSFHGLPAHSIKLGDPYYYQCKTTAKLLAKALALKDNQWQLVFQSRFGKAEWLKPYCIEVLQQLPKQGVKKLDIVCPGFAIDCLETLEEIALTNRQLFIEAGGETYNYIPALNASKNQANFLMELLK